MILSTMSVTGNPGKKQIRYVHVPGIAILNTKKKNNSSDKK